jgi:hypothetical protein
MIFYVRDKAGNFIPIPAIQGPPGPNGAPGAAPRVGANGNWYIGTTDTGVKAAGTNGADGKGIKSVARTSGNGAAGTTDTYTITYTDNTTGTFQVRNGSNGAAGKAATFEITGATALPYGAAPTVTEEDDSAEQARKYALGIPAGKPGEPGNDGHTPERGTDYWTPADKAEIESYIATELAKRGQLKPEPAESLEWLKDNGDTSKMYVLLDKSAPAHGYIIAWMLTEKEVSSGGGYTNVMDNPNAYIKKGYRYSMSSQAFKEVTGSADVAALIIPIPASGELTIRVRGMKYNAGYPAIYGGTTNAAFSADLGGTTDTYDSAGDWYFTVSNTSGSSYIVTTGLLEGDKEDVIVTINEEITEGGGTEIVTEYAWANTGLSFIPADYEPRIIDLEEQVAKNTTAIAKLKQGITATTDIEDWDAPIYDANIPVFQLSAEKAAMTNATNTPANIYAKYDALMAKHPRYITKTDLGLCSDGVNHVYRYDFREPEPHYESGKVWSETKTKAILMTGVHFEWAGIYSLYYALEEIADNPELRNFRRNTHLIVVPVANPYATIANNYQSGLSTPNSYGVRNANGVEIHRNFEVDWILNEAGSTHYGGPEPLSEVETQYIDNILKNNTDAAVFLSCHNCGVETVWGTGFIWSSTATKYMCNMGFRLVDKLSDAWMDKYGDILSAGIEEYKTDALADGDTRLGWAGLSTSPGTEAKQATKYGIQGTNVEICDPFQIHGTKESPEPSMSAFTMSRGAEAYVNFLLTAFGVYDPKDKQQYAPVEA